MKLGKMQEMLMKVDLGGSHPASPSTSFQYLHWPPNSTFYLFIYYLFIYLLIYF